MSVEEKAIEESAKTIRAYLDPMLLSPLSELGLMMKDQVSYWRFKNQVNIALKAKSFLDARGIKSENLFGQLKPSIVVPIIESSGIIDDETLAGMFAKLLANSIDPSTSSSIHPSFTSILGQLAPVDARILNDLYNEIHPVIVNPMAFPQFSTSEPLSIPIHRKLGYSEDALLEIFSCNTSSLNLSLENINRLGIGDSGFNSLDRVNKKCQLFLTDFGLLFMEKCSAENTESGDVAKRQHKTRR